MIKRGSKHVAMSLVMLTIGFVLSLYLTIPKYSPLFESTTYTLSLKAAEETYLLDLINFSAEHGALWGNITLNPSVKATIHLSLSHLNGSKSIMIVNLTPESTNNIHLTGCIIEEAFVVPEDDGVLKYNFKVLYREEASLSLIAIAVALIVVGSALGYRGVMLILSES
ncbi:MAG: hypothetical protein N3F04_07175 [Candidatus Nezhaarchaeota archaeon]|nr:hypothetical protein [Candidatus Nezhaarchaeota archaeon]MCX8142525.1 hypothetical protein [Candidatus Nezhaarchaeota archaeon]MDW8050502.1 hypothetical protein [Nitrososphaerota archaeon]